MRVKAYMAAYFLAQAVYQSYISLFYRARGLDAAGLGALCVSRQPPRLVLHANGMASGKAKLTLEAWSFLVHIHHQLYGTHDHYSDIDASFHGLQNQSRQIKSVL